MQKLHEYILSVGQKGANRLDLLNEIYGPYSQNFLLNVGLKDGMTILDAGCGTGNMTCWLAQQIGPTGKVIGIDASEEQLKLAERQAKQKNLSNVEFKQCSVYEIASIKVAFDLIYSRFLLIHLTHPKQALQAMYDCLAVGGILACDEQALSAACCFPPSEAFSKSISLGYQMTKHKGIDFDLGMKLYSLFKEVKLNEINMKVAQPVLLTQQHKMLWPMFFEESKAIYLSSGLLSDLDHEKLIQGLMEIVINDNYYILPMRNHHIWGKR